MSSKTPKPKTKTSKDKLLEIMNVIKPTLLKEVEQNWTKDLNGIPYTFDAEFEAQVWKETEAKIKSMTVSAIADLVNENINNMVYGQHNAYWLAFYDTFRKFGIEECARLEGHNIIAESCNWWLPLGHFAICSDKHNVLNLDDQGRLHCEDGPALSFNRSTLNADYDLHLYFMEGIKLTEQIIMHPETLTIAQIDKERNAEIRRIMINKFGVENYLMKSEAEVVDNDEVKSFPEDPNPMPRALIKTKTNDLWLVGTDGSTKRTYFMPVMPGVKTCKQAHESIAGRPEDDLKYQG